MTRAIFLNGTVHEKATMEKLKAGLEEADYFVYLKGKGKSPYAGVIVSAVDGKWVGYIAEDQERANPGVKVGDRVKIDLGRSNDPAHGRVGVVTHVYEAPSRPAVEVQDHEGHLWTVHPSYVKLVKKED